MKNYDKKEESLYVQYLDANNLYVFVGSFMWIEDISEIDKDFIKNYDENSDIGYFLKVDFKYPTELHDLHSDLPFLPERMKINKCSKLVCNLYGKENYVVHIKALKQT